MLVTLAGHNGSAGLRALERAIWAQIRAGLGAVGGPLASSFAPYFVYKFAMQLGDAGVVRLAKELAKALRTEGHGKGAANGGMWSTRGGGGARGKSGGGSLPGRPGDWTCGSLGCGYRNFANRQECRSCGSGRRGSSSKGFSARDGSPAPSTRTFVHGKGGGKGRTSNGVVAGKSFAAAASAPAPARPLEFVRQPRGKGADMCTQASTNSTPPPPPPPIHGERLTWFDISANDSETVVEGDDPAEGGAARGKDGQDGGTTGTGSTSDSQGVNREELQQKLKRCKKVISMLSREGCGEGDEAFDGAQRDLAHYTAKLESSGGANSQPTGSSLDRAEKQLKKANAARAALDKERADLDAKYQQDLEKLQGKYRQVDARIELHAKKIKDIKSALGGGSKVPKRVEKGVAAAKDILAALGPSITGVLELLRPDPRYQANPGAFDNIGVQLGQVYSHLLSTTEAIEEAVVEESSDEDSDSGDDWDEEEDDDAEEMDVHDVDDDSAATATQPAEQIGNAASSDLGTQQIADSIASAPPPPTPLPEMAAGTGTPQPATTAAQGATAASSSAAAAAGAQRGGEPAAKKPKVPHHKLNPSSSKAVIRDGKHKNSAAQKPAAAGGATAPMLAPMQDTSTSAQEGNRIVEGGDDDY